MSTASLITEVSGDEDEIKTQLRLRAEQFKAGQIRDCYHKWKEISVDCEVLNMVSGVDIQFEELPRPTKLPYNHCFFSRINMIKGEKKKENNYGK